MTEAVLGLCEAFLTLQKPCQAVTMNESVLLVNLPA